MRWILLCGCALVACGDDSRPTDAGVDAALAPVDASVDASVEADAFVADAGCALPAAEVVRFTTDDGLMLEADH